MIKTFLGNVWKFGDNINTDVISPSKYLSLPISEMKKHAFEPVMPNFAKEVEAGDIIIGGKNFGCGSSREQAVMVIKALHVGAVVAESFARIFFRNAVAQGLPIMICNRASRKFKKGEKIEVNIIEATIKEVNTNKMVKGVKLSKEVLDIIEKGGILELLKLQKCNIL